MRLIVKMAKREPRTARSTGLSDKEIAEALGISLERFVAVLVEAGLRPRPTDCDA